jgi:Mg/Co/Ni transporter MgtE
MTRTPSTASSRALAAALTGVLVGLVLGVAVDAAIWLWAFGQALGGHVGIDVPLIVTTNRERGDVVAESGAGLVVIPLAAAVMGCAVGWIVGRRRADRVPPAAHTR